MFRDNLDSLRPPGSETSAATAGHALSHAWCAAAVKLTVRWPGLDQWSACEPTPVFSLNWFRTDLH